MGAEAFKHIVRFERGHNCMDFECLNDHPACRPGSDGYHGLHGMQIRWVVVGQAGAVQFLLYTGWVPVYLKESCGSAVNFPLDYGSKFTMPTDLGYHSRKPRYEGQGTMGPCEWLEGANCFYDGSGLNAGAAFYTLVNAGDDALWDFLEGYYRHVFDDGPYPQRKEYCKALRTGREARR